jgi:heme-degrading monooxygenase HmoA
MRERFARTPRPPYYAAIFTSQRRNTDEEGYRLATRRMMELAGEVPGYLGAETVREADGFGLTISYWDSEQAILEWKSQAEHAEIRERGRWLWYEHFEVRIARVERAYGGR